MSKFTVQFSAIVALVNNIDHDTFIYSNLILNANSNETNT